MDASEEYALSEIVVTGSRIVHAVTTKFQPVALVTLLEGDTLTNSSEIGVEQSLNKMPQFVPGQSQFSDSGSNHRHAAHEPG